MKALPLLLPLLVALSAAQETVIPGTNYILSWKALPACASGGQLVIASLSRPDAPLLSTSCGSPFLQLGLVTLDGPPVSLQGGYTLAEALTNATSVFSLTDLTTTPSAVALSGNIDSICNVLILFSAGPTPQQVAIAFDFGIVPAPFNRAYVSIASTAKEGIVGLGTQYTKWNLKGSAVSASAECAHAVAADRFARRLRRRFAEKATSDMS